MDESNFDVLDRVCKAAELSILTLCNPVWKVKTELRLILFTVIKALNAIVSSLAPVFFRASISLGKFAQFGRVQFVFSPFVFE